MMARCCVQVACLILPHMIEVEFRAAFIIDQQNVDIVLYMTQSHCIHIIEESQIANHKIALLIACRGLPQERRKTAIYTVCSDIRIGLNSTSIICGRMRQATCTQQRAIIQRLKAG